MFSPILATKLYIPPPRPNIVPRPRLFERLNAGLQRKLTLISAPPGFGKTTLLSEWAASCGKPAAWLSLDEGDNDLTRFLSYLVAALQTLTLSGGEGAAASIGADVLDMLRSPQQLQTETILIALLNAVAALPNDCVLILDDYYAVDSQPVDNALAYLVEHMPPQLHLVIATREDPQLPLPRYRARGHLAELRLAELRFTPAEAAEFLNRMMDLDLSADEISALETRTEGWIAGLQLAALSMQGLHDRAGFIQSFTGSHHFVLDYLLEEVLHKQPESIQAFLLQTSILERMCGPLCDAVCPANTGAADMPSSGQETLEYLERANLFIVPLDKDRHWYRYHHLFAELLHNRLRRSYSDKMSELHRRASDWFAHNDYPNEAVTHALAVQDWDRAANIIERFSDQWPMRGEISTLLGWLEAFPARMRLERTRLGVIYAWILFMANHADRAEQHINQLMPLVQNIPNLIGELYAIRVMLATQRFDVPAVIDLAQQALGRVPPEEAVPRSRILVSLGFAYEAMGGDLTAARNAFREAYELSAAIPTSSYVGNAPLPLTALAYLAEIERYQGNLREASRMYNHALELAELWGGQTSLALAIVQQGRAALLFEWNELDEAAHALQECIRIGELWKHPFFLVPAYGLMAMVMQAVGQPLEAGAMIHRAEETTRFPYSSSRDQGSFALYQIQLWIAQNDFHAITQWERNHDPGWLAQIGRSRDALAIVLAQARIARHYRRHDASALDEARALIKPALEATQAAGLMDSAVRLLILDALVCYAQGEAAEAIATLKRALSRAEPEKYVRSFLELGRPMEEYLTWSLESESLNEPQLRSYAGKLLSLFGGVLTSTQSQRTTGELIEALTERELEVLRLVAQGLSNREISERLFLALSTVKGYNRIIFDKLQVQSRTGAIARARELGLL